MTTDKPSRNEDEYFAKLDAELLKATRDKDVAEREAAERASHHMKCPKDGYDLTTRDQDGVHVDVCTHCGGLWLDAGELDQLLAREEPGVLQRVIGDVRAALGGRKRAAE